jgi:hypothetical protein
MPRSGFVFLFCLMMSCSNNKPAEKVENNFSYEELAKSFKQVSVPYQLSDSFLVSSKDTNSIRFAEFETMIDSLKTSTLGKAKAKYIPLALLKVPKAESYMIVRANAGNKKAAYLLAFDNKQKFSAAMPFLLPDNDRTTFQSSSIDRSYSIIKSISKKGANDVMVDGKEVYGFDASSGRFNLILTDKLENEAREMINPIDTLGQMHKFSGDYYLDKHSLVSVRDGRNANQLNIFIYLDRNKGKCIGELKGEILVKDKAAVFRQSGNPCALELVFGNNTVTLKEKEGCGSSRGVDCVFDGTYAKKKKPKSKTK